ncbi:MAG: phosphoglucosamine mutase [Pseudomonadota bacterium]
MKKQYFGTDGIRGKVGEFPINAEFMLKLGWATGRVLASDKNPRVIIGKDTRISGYLFESSLKAGLVAAGVETLLIGPMPTPGIAYLTRTLRCSAGIVISASHNPYWDNGIKFFSSEGLKLSDDVELEIEKVLAEPMQMCESHKLGKARYVTDAAGRYIEFCKSTVPSSINLKDLTIVIDCAHGATYHIAPAVFRELGANVIKMGCEPNGLNINEGFGSTSPQTLVEKVKETGADLGIAFDGDGDRVIMVDEKGQIVDGDEFVYIIASDSKQSGRLQGGVVGTLMSNLGLEIALKEKEIPFARSKVGDRYVMELLKDNDWLVGGESSGHIICLDKTSTGDGIVAALQILLAMKKSQKSLHQLKSEMVKYPQKMINVRFSQTESDPIEHPSVIDAVKKVEDELGEEGRVLLRKSGTEPLIRVMVEGKNNDVVTTKAEQLAKVVREICPIPTH